MKIDDWIFFSFYFFFNIDISHKLPIHVCICPNVSFFSFSFLLSNALVSLVVATSKCYFFLFFFQARIANAILRENILTILIVFFPFKKRIYTMFFKSRTFCIDIYQTFCIDL